MRVEILVVFISLIAAPKICDGFVIQSQQSQLQRATAVLKGFSADSAYINDDADDDNIYDGDDEWADEHQVYWLDPEAEFDESLSLGEAIGQGQAVVCISDVASNEDCLALFSAGLQAVEKRSEPAVRGRSRFSVADPESFSNDVVLRCDEMLLEVLDYLDDEIPSIYDTLFKPSDSWLSNQPSNAQLEQLTVPPLEYVADMCYNLRDLYMQSELEWSEGEPAINIYETDGYFGAHKDHLGLTVLIPLTAPSQDFSGGGTGFWRGNRQVSENPTNPPDLVLKPPPGTALVFGGDVTHAGMPVENGYRSVFVCSFSTKTPVSLKDRLHGMQAPPQVSPNFKGTM
eukprot:CAMPEP_0198145934 /NCGR_PEP_ID=MMETSP1443-20131203/26245_1 /TAXON_ID=186043 /ORGANISM="Entomoneis sp., Strain CCMP2396" /LENGTH=342 /DNA_ID=CAMNT_0043809699 /DNA_START=32 /DNA_END=1060 /DNA_ORIENTATION=-